jgi:hypothetical protein
VRAEHCANSVVSRCGRRRGEQLGRSVRLCRCWGTLGEVRRHVCLTSRPGSGGLSDSHRTAEYQQ